MRGRLDVLASGRSTNASRGAPLHHRSVSWCARLVRGGGHSAVTSTRAASAACSPSSASWARATSAVQDPATRVLVVLEDAARRRRASRAPRVRVVVPLVLRRCIVRAGPYISL